MIDTTKGPIDESLLEKRDGIDDNETAFVEWVEYWLDGELVHRSAHAHMKAGVVSLLEGSL
jgi:hypothetical protein